jgi:plasmid rolling circle replication initiator protein Rep
MTKQPQKAPPRRKNKPGVKAQNASCTRALDTKAQLATKPPTKQRNACKTAHYNAYEQLDKTRQRKAYTNSIAKRLVLAETPLQNQYKRVLACSELVEIVRGENGNTYTRSKRCKSRLCAVCNAIRTRDAIVKYTPVIETWNEVTFVTLTLTSVQSHQLRATILEMVEIYQAILAKFKARASRGKGVALVGIRKLECTYNEKGMFHPHFHVILKGSESLANQLVIEWVNRVNNSGYHKADMIAQKATGVQNIADACNELFKYTTKLLASSGKAKDNNGNWNKSDYINIASLDRILQATTRKRTVQPFGFVAPKEQPTNSEKQAPESVHVFDQEQKAYFELSTGEQSTPKSLHKHVKMFISKVEKQAARDRVNPPNIYESYTIKKAHQLDKADTGNIGHHKSNSSPGGDG